MKKASLLKTALFLCVISLCSGGCVVYPRASVGAEVDVVGEPPAPIVEEVYPAPGVGFVWIGGAWAWHGRWVWERGRWARPPHPGAVWVPHRYDNGRHVYIRGGWR
ncbi:MAG: hypothetical protein ABSA45_03750 [Verrucomicrobiota bacterium]